MFKYYKSLIKVMDNKEAKLIFGCSVAKKFDYKISSYSWVILETISSKERLINTAIQTGTHW